MNNTLTATTATGIKTTDLQTVELALLDAIELAEARGDLNLAVIYAKLLRTKVKPALRRGHGL
tara:strand:+ start:1653 stop:1841 length:189 start_codon:yes stop_codon:yes gene_type:complete